MKKIMLLLMFFGIVSVQLYGRPVGLENCGNTCFQNGFIQLVFQIDPLIDILSKQQDLYMQNTLGYLFQHLVWDMLNAQKNKKPFIECGPADNPTNLKKFTEGVYSCRNLPVGSQQDLAWAFQDLVVQLERTFSKELTSVLNVLIESITNIPGNLVITEKTLREPYFKINETGNFENDIREFFNPKKNLSDEWWEPRFLSVPKFLIFQNSSADEISNFPDELNLTPYIRGYSQALYQLRAITVHVSVGAGGHYFAIVRDRDDGKLYVCNDSNIRQINSWHEESLGSHNLLLYVLKTSTNATDNLRDKLIKLRQSLNNLKFLLTK